MVGSVHPKGDRARGTDKHHILVGQGEGCPFVPILVAGEFHSRCLSVQSNYSCFLEYSR